MTNPTTAAEMPSLKPCPFCGDLMEWWGEDMIRHRESGECPLGMMGFVAQHIPAWNRRPLPSDDEMVERVLGDWGFVEALIEHATHAHADKDLALRKAVIRAAIAAMRGEP